MLYALCSMLFAIIITGCGEESPLEHEDSVLTIKSQHAKIKTVAPVGWMPAIQFPTSDGCSWTYISVDGEHAYTSRIAGAQNLGGLAVRVMENRLLSDIPLDIPVDHLSSLYGLPIHTSFFTKDLDSYTEHAFELWLDALGDTFFQRHSPKRVLWSFPLYEGKEWIVSKSYMLPEITYTRKVISARGVLTVPADTFREVYYVEEYVSFGDEGDDQDIVNKYWLAPDVGVVKYEYVDSIFDTTQTYELSEFKKGS